MANTFSLQCWVYTLCQVTSSPVALDWLVRHTSLCLDPPIPPTLSHLPLNDALHTNLVLRGDNLA